MQSRLSLITLGVADLDRASEFYAALGFERRMKDTPGVAFFQLGGLALSLFPRPELAKDAGVDPAGSGFSGFSLAYNCRPREDVDTTIAAFIAAGGSLVKPAERKSWGGYSGYVADPDGFLWEIAQNPGFQFDADGGVILEPSP